MHTHSHTHSLTHSHAHSHTYSYLCTYSLTTHWHSHMYVRENLNTNRQHIHSQLLQVVIMDVEAWTCKPTRTVDSMYKFIQMNTHKNKQRNFQKHLQPYPTLPNPTQPYPTLPNPTQPYPTLPNPTQPYPTLPNPTLPNQTLPNPTQPNPGQDHPIYTLNQRSSITFKPTQSKPIQTNPTQPNPTSPHLTQDKARPVTQVIVFKISFQELEIPSGNPIITS